MPTSRSPSRSSPARLRRGGAADGPRQPTRPTRSGARGRDVARAGDRVATAGGAAQRPALLLRAVEPRARRGARRRVPARDGDPRDGRDGWRSRALRLGGLARGPIHVSRDEEVATMDVLADDRSVIQRILDHIDNDTTDVSETVWREPVEHYRSPERFAAELALVLRRFPTPFCPSAALPGTGSFVARDAAGIPILAVRGNDGRVRAFRTACRHRGTQLVDGSGCEKAFVCPYHGWTYGLDGALRHVPHEHGFPGLEKSTRGLVPVEAAERRGLVFVTQDAARARLDELPPLIPSDRRLFGTFA